MSVGFPLNSINVTVKHSSPRASSFKEEKVPHYKLTVYIIYQENIHILELKGGLL